MIIKMHVNMLRNRLKMVGYTLDEVQPAIVKREGDFVYFDLESPSCPKGPKPGFTPPPFVPHAPPAGGPGTELKKLLSLVRIAVAPNCSCTAYAAQMDAWGPDGCLERLPEIVAHLEAQAKGRRLPFSRVVAEKLVRVAIGRARKKASIPPGNGHKP